jgi:diacylglycerol kinase family enzyme
MADSESVLIINPTRYPRRVPKLIRQAQRADLGPVRVTQSREDFINAVAAFAESESRYVLIWGGDGTVHDAVNALMQVRENGVSLAGKAVGFLRGGSGNGTQDSYDVPRRLTRQVEAYRTAMDEGMTVDVDLLRVDAAGDVRYGQLMGLGFDTRVLERRRRGVGGAAPPGVVRYVYAASRVFFSREWAHRPVRLKLREGKYAFRGIRINAEFAFQSIERDLEISLLEIGTRPYYGAQFKVCPDVVCNDGMMDVYAYAFTRRGQVVRNVGALWLGRHGLINDRLMGSGRRGVIERYEVRAAAVTVSREHAYHVDGELLSLPEDPAAKVITVDLIPQGLRFLVPPSYYRLVHPFEE